MGARDIEGEAPAHGEILRGVVLSASGLILVEDDIEGPVQGVFDAPMLAHNAQKLGGLVVPGQQEVAFDSLVAAPLALDPSDRNEAWEVVLFGQVLCRSNDGRADFLAAMSGVAGRRLFGLRALGVRDG